MVVVAMAVERFIQQTRFLVGSSTCVIIHPTMFRRIIIQYFCLSEGTEGNDWHPEGHCLNQYNPERLWEVGWISVSNC